MAQSQTARAADAKAQSAIEIKPFHQDVAKACDAHRRSGETMAQKLKALLLSKYGECLPSANDYSIDQRALAIIAEQRGLADNQWVRKPYAAAVKALYGCLPVGTGEDAKAKRMERYTQAQRKAYDEACNDPAVAFIDEAHTKPRAAHWIAALAHTKAMEAGKAKDAAPAAGAPAGQTQQHVTPLNETIEQFIARVGDVAVLEAIVRVLNVDKSTQTQAKTINAIVNQLRQMRSPADVSNTSAKKVA